MSFDPRGSRHVDGEAIIKRLASELDVHPYVLRAALERLLREIGGNK
jgi:hypothetical protein